MSIAMFCGGGENKGQIQKIYEEKEMTRPMSRKERKQAFMNQAEEMFEEMESWYDENPKATFEEIEERARQAR